MFDLEVVVAISSQTTGHHHRKNRHIDYGQRIKDFKKIGLLNINKNQVLINLLTGTETFENIEIGWPKNVATNVVPSYSNDASAKTYSFYSTLSHVNSKWHIKIDDDTSTDVSGLIENLKSFEGRSRYLVPAISYRAQKEEIKCLKELNIENDYQWMHERECAILSKECLEQILNNETAMKFIKLRSKLESGWSDIALAYAAIISGVKIEEVGFVEEDKSLAWTRYFSLFGGEYNHIHGVNRDDNNKGEPQIVEKLMSLYSKELLM